MQATEGENRDDHPSEDAEEEVSSVDEQEEEQYNDDNDLDGEEEEEENHQQNLMDGLPDYIVRRVERLKVLDQTREAYMKDYLVERSALEAKYDAMCKTLYKERAQIVKGEKDVDAEENHSSNKVTTTTSASNKEEKKDDSSSEQQRIENPNPNATTQDDDDGQERAIQGIPQFWVCSMGHMEAVGTLLEEEDVECLEYLDDITCTDDADGKGFTLKFFFRPNPYFENSELTKKYEVPNLLLGDEPVLKNVKGCTIQWKPDKCLTYKTVQKKQRGTGKHAGQVRTVTKKERQESFFHWFEPPQMPSLEDMDEDAAEKLEELFEQDFDIATSFRQHIIPKAVQWFTGEVAQQDLDSAVNALIQGH